MRLLLPLFLFLAPLAGAQPLAHLGAPVAAVVSTNVAIVDGALPSMVAVRPAASTWVGDTPVVSVFPNPAVESATVRFSLARAERFELAVFDLLGRRVQQRDLGVLSSGQHEAAIDLRGLPAGLYMIRLSGDSGSRATVRITRAAGA